MIEVDVVGVERRVPTDQEWARMQAAAARLATEGDRHGRVPLVDQEREVSVVRLRQREGGRVLDLFIGDPEAMAIGMGLQHVDVPRPMTHDFVGNVVAALGATPVRAVVTKVADGTFYGELILRRGDDEGEEVAVDCRPSDGIALAVRHELPVFVDDSLDTVFVAA